MLSPYLPPPRYPHPSTSLYSLTVSRLGLDPVAANAVAVVWFCPNSPMRKLRPRQRVELGPLDPYVISVSSTPQGLVLMAASPADASRRRREKRRQLDARRSKCRIRLGGHMEQWCLLKEQLGFSLHSQLAKFLLDRLGPGSGVLREGTQATIPSTLPVPSPRHQVWSCCSLPLADFSFQKQGQGGL